VAARRGHNKAAIAVANTLARIVWAVWRTASDLSHGHDSVFSLIAGRSPHIP
jgi:hypothetical protein